MIDDAILKEICSDWPEIQVFYAIRELGGFIFHMNHDMADGRIPDKDHPSIDVDVRKAVEESTKIVKSLTRFGLEKPTEENGAATAEYWKWYRWWDSYECSLSTKQFLELEKVLESKGDLTPWRPEGDWKKS